VDSKAAALRGVVGGSDDHDIDDAYLWAFPRQSSPFNPSPIAVTWPSRDWRFWQLPPGGLSLTKLRAASPHLLAQPLLNPINHASPQLLAIA